MSKTQKTRPLWVRMLDPKDPKVGVEEIHNHVKGYCDLPERNVKALEEHYAEVRNHEDIAYRESCRFGFTYRGKGVCGCRMCTEHDERKVDNRKKRHKARISLKGASKTTRAFLDNPRNEGILDDDRGTEKALYVSTPHYLR